MGAGEGFSNRLTGWGSFREALVSSRAIVIHRFVLAAVTVLCIGMGGLAFGSVSALAAAPEAPGPVTVEHFGATRVSVHGLLSPEAEGYPGTYEFLYRASKTGCEGGEHAPSSAPGLAMGGQGEEVSQELTGLSPETEYTVCLLERNLNQAKGEETVGPATTFKTTETLEAPTITVPASPSITSSSAKLQGVLNPSKPGNPGTYEFVYSQSASECERENTETHQLESEHATSTEGALGGEKEVVPASEPVEVGGLLPNMDYSVCLLARNEAGETALSSPMTFTTLPEEPSISNESVSNLGSVGVTVSAEINIGGLETTYRVQYGASTAYGTETTVASTTGSRNVSVTLEKLEPNTEYHFKFIATNGKGTIDGSDMTFTTYSTGITGLPDGRVYEMVSPPANHNADVYAPEGVTGMIQSYRSFRAAADGDAVAYIGAPTVGGNGKGGTDAGDEYLSVRGPQGGWSQSNIIPSGDNTGAYQAFSSDLSIGFFSSLLEKPPFVLTENFQFAGSEEFSYWGLYSRDFDEKDYRPVFTVTPPLRVPEEFGTYGVLEPTGDRNSGHAAVYAGSSADSDSTLFEANDDLLEGNGGLEQELHGIVENEAAKTKASRRLVEEERTIEREEDEYPHGSQPYHEKEVEIEKKQAEREAFEVANTAVDDRNELYVSIGGGLSLVNVLPEGAVSPGATFGGTSSGAVWEDQAGFSHVISADGSRIFWTSVENVFRATPRFSKTLVALPKAVYVREDGSRTVQVSPGPAEFWTASTNGKYAFYTEAGKLWRFDVEDESRVELAGSGSGGVQGVIGTNETGEEGAYVYFVSKEALPGVKNGAGVSPVAEEDNLYSYASDPEHAGQSRIVFVGTLAEEDSKDWALGLGERTAEPTVDGEDLVFASHRNLTGASYPGEGSEEVYVFDANGSSLFCASCRAQASGGHLNPTNLLTYMYRWISEDGDRVFFDSEAPLVASDVNGQEDVYEWERGGTGACSEGDGCIYLISGGVSSPASFIDASASGKDVFFVTREKLVPEDQNENVDIYDARIDGALPVAAPACTGTGCQGIPAAAPIFATPASVTFNGVGNFSPSTPTAVVKIKKKTLKCAKGKKQSHGKCVKTRHKKRKVKVKIKARRSTNGKGSK